MESSFDPWVCVDEYKFFLKDLYGDRKTLNLKKSDLKKLLSYEFRGEAIVEYSNFTDKIIEECPSEVVRELTYYFFSIDDKPSLAISFGAALAFWGSLWHQKITFEGTNTNMLIVGLGAINSKKRKLLASLEWLHKKLKRVENYCEIPVTGKANFDFLVDLLSVTEGDVFCSTDTFGSTFLRESMSTNFERNYLSSLPLYEQVATLSWRSADQPYFYSPDPECKSSKIFKKLRCDPLCNPHLTLFGICDPFTYYRFANRAKEANTLLGHYLVFTDGNAKREKPRKRFTQIDKILFDDLKTANAVQKRKEQETYKKFTEIVCYPRDVEMENKAYNYYLERADYFDELCKVGDFGFSPTQEELIKIHILTGIARHALKISLIVCDKKTFNVTLEDMKFAFKVAEACAHNLIKNLNIENVPIRRNSIPAMVEKYISSRKGWAAYPKISYHFSSVAKKSLINILKNLKSKGLIVEEEIEYEDGRREKVYLAV